MLYFVDLLDRYSSVKYAIPFRQVRGQSRVSRNIPKAGAAGGRAAYLASVGRRMAEDGEG